MENVYEKKQTEKFLSCYKHLKFEQIWKNSKKQIKFILFKLCSSFVSTEKDKNRKKSWEEKKYFIWIWIWIKLYKDKKE